MWTRFIDSNFKPELQNFVPYRNVFQNGYIKTPTVQRLARDHFGCDTLEGLMHDGGHWKANPLAFELMISSNYNGLGLLHISHRL